MTSRPDGAGGESLAWTDLATETTTPLPGSVGHDSHSDVAVTSDGATYHTQDMTPPGTPTPGIDLTKELGPDAAFVGAVGNLLFAVNRVKVGAGFQAYGVIEGAGDLAGGPAADFVARDSSGVLWSFLGKGDGTFANRTGAGGGWNAYNKITAGSDLTGDGCPDLVAVDAAGALWLHKATGDWKAPFAAARVKLAAGGFNTYDRLTAVGDVAGGAAGDVVARDTTGVLWLFPGKGDGTFLPRVRIGGGWNAFSQLVGMGDADDDGRADLLAYGSGGTYVYLGTGTESAPFTRIPTSLYRGEGTKFDSVS